MQKQLGHSFISITVDIYGHWIPGEGKKDLMSTLRGLKARPGQTLTVVTGVKPHQWHQEVETGFATNNGSLLGRNWDGIGAEDQIKRRNQLRLRLN